VSSLFCFARQVSQSLLTITTHTCVNPCSDRHFSRPGSKVVLSQSPNWTRSQTCPKKGRIHHSGYKTPVLLLSLAMHVASYTKLNERHFRHRYPPWSRKLITLVWALVIKRGFLLERALPLLPLPLLPACIDYLLACPLLAFNTLAEGFCQCQTGVPLNRLLIPSQNGPARIYPRRRVLPGKA